MAASRPQALAMVVLYLSIAIAKLRLTLPPWNSIPALPNPVMRPCVFAGLIEFDWRTVGTYNCAGFHGLTFGRQQDHITG